MSVFLRDQRNKDHAATVNRTVSAESRPIVTLGAIPNAPGACHRDSHGQAMLPWYQTVYSSSIVNKEKKLVVVTTKVRNLDPRIGVSASTYAKYYYRSAIIFDIFDIYQESSSKAHMVVEVN